MRIDRRHKRGGFSLAEILVAIVIVAAVASVVLPTIFGQINKADPTQVGNAALAVRGAVEQFLADVRRYPLNFSQLTTVIAVSPGETALVGGNYAEREVARWKGPYLQKDATSALLTGWDLQFDAAFGILTPGSPDYVTLTLVIVQAKAQMVDDMFDDGVLTTGSFRWATGTLSFLVVPIQ